MAGEKLGGSVEMMRDGNGVGDFVAGEIGEDLENSSGGFVFKDFAVGFHDSDGFVIDEQTITVAHFDGEKKRGNWEGMDELICFG